MRFDPTRLIAQTRAEAFDEAVAWHRGHETALYLSFGPDHAECRLHRNCAAHFDGLGAVERAKLAPASPPDTIHTYQDGQHRTYEAGDDWPAQDGGIDL